MSKHGASPDHLLLIFTSFICPILEYAAPVWHFGLMTEQSARIKIALMIVSKQAEMLYEELLKKFKMQILKKRRETVHEIWKKISDPPNPQTPFPPSIHNKTTPAQGCSACWETSASKLCPSAVSKKFYTKFCKYVQQKFLSFDLSYFLCIFINCAERKIWNHAINEKFMCLVWK